MDANRTSDDRRLLLLLLDCNQEDPPHFLSKERITEAYLRVVGYLYIQGRVLFLLLYCLFLFLIRVELQLLSLPF